MSFAVEPIARPRDIIYDTLFNDPTVSTSTRFVAFLKRLPQAGLGQSATPEAFYPGNHPTEAGKLKPTIAVLDGGDNPSPNGAAHNGRVGFPLVYGFAPVSPAGDEMLSYLSAAIENHFPNDESHWYPLGTGPGVEIKRLERQLIRNADDLGFPGRQYAIWRIQATFVRV